MLVLGLDVLGNPYALIHGIGEGVRDFFYEPYQVRSLRQDFFFRKISHKTNVTLTFFKTQRQ